MHSFRKLFEAHRLATSATGQEDGEGLGCLDQGLCVISGKAVRLQATVLLSLQRHEGRRVLHCIPDVQRALHVMRFSLS